MRASSSLIQGAKSSGREFGKRQQQVRQVALRIDDDRGNAVDRGLFEQARHRPVLPLPVMPTQTAWVTRSLRRTGAAFRVAACVEIVFAAEVEGAQLLVILHVRQMGNLMPWASGNSRTNSL